MPQQLQFRDLSQPLGAEVDGFDPQAESDDETWHLLSRSFDDRGLLVFRDHDLDSATQHRVVERLYASGGPGTSEQAANERFSYVSNADPTAARRTAGCCSTPT